MTGAGVTSPWAYALPTVTSESMSAHNNLEDAQMDRIMEMSIEELAASEGKTIEQALAEGKALKERILANMRGRFPHLKWESSDE